MEECWYHNVKKKQDIKGNTFYNIKLFYKSREKLEEITSESCGIVDDFHFLYFLFIVPQFLESSDFFYNQKKSHFPNPTPPALLRSALSW